MHYNYNQFDKTKTWKSKLNYNELNKERKIWYRPEKNLKVNAELRLVNLLSAVEQF